jgi:O-antigen/teichoic acid export membrane protein
MVMLTTLPALLVLAASSEYVLAFVGPQWEVGADAMKLMCVVGIVKGLVHFTGPLLFAVARPLTRALMLWVIAAINVTAVVIAGTALESASSDDQLIGMSTARVLVSLLVVVPINLVIIHRLAGIRPRRLVPWAAAPLAAGITAIAVVQGITAVGVLDGAPPFVALIVAGGLAAGVCLGVLLALDPRARTEAGRIRGLVRRRRRRGALVADDSAVSFVDGVDGPPEDLDRPETAFTDRRVPHARAD